MIRRIIEHNRLNGVAFSITEFLIVAAAAGFIGAGFGIHERWLGLALAVGTTLNCLVVVAFGVGALRRGERGSSLRSLANAAYRQELAREHPAMMKDTIILAAATLAPYVLLVTVAAERARTG